MNPDLRELNIEPIYLEGRNPLRPPVHDNRGMGYPTAPKDWRPPVAADLNGSLPAVVDVLPASKEFPS